MVGRIDGPNLKSLSAPLQLPTPRWVGRELVAKVTLSNTSCGVAWTNCGWKNRTFSWHVWTNPQREPRVVPLPRSIIRAFPTPSSAPAWIRMIDWPLRRPQRRGPWDPLGIRTGWVWRERAGTSTEIDRYLAPWDARIWLACITNRPRDLYRPC